MEIVKTLGIALIGVLIRFIYEKWSEKRKFKRELEDNNFIDISGTDWHAAWQTSVDNEMIINTEKLSMTQVGNVVKVKNLEKSLENPRGGYLWDAQMQFFQGKYMMGWYFPLKTENNTSKGIMFFSYHSAKKIFYGKWVGAAFDGDLANGFLVISKDRTESLSELNKIIVRNPDKVNIIFSQIG